MDNNISISTSYDVSLFRANVSGQMVTSAVDAIISRFAPVCLALMREAKDNLSIISDYRSSLLGYYQNMTMTPQMKASVVEAQRMAPDWKVIKKTLASGEKISVFSEKEFDEKQANDRFYIRLRVERDKVKEGDALDNLLSQLSREILSQGYNGEGIFDIRLEKGCLSLEGEPWRWHFDGEVFKTSLTLCYSNKKDWSTRIRDLNGKERPADHGSFYDALKVYHRAPIPSDVKGEINPEDYRLFIRYNEFHKKPGERTIHKSPAIDPRKDKEKQPDLSALFEMHKQVDVSKYAAQPKDDNLKVLLAAHNNTTTIPVIKIEFSNELPKIEIDKMLGDLAIQPLVKKEDEGSSCAVM